MRRRDFLAQAGAAGFSAVAAAARPPLAWAQSATGYSEDYAKGDGVRLYFVRAGDGPLMVCLHGHPDNWSLYEAQLGEFKRDHLVVAPNLRGYPLSDAPASVEAYAMPRLLGDLHGLLDHLGRERCILVGNDWGGYIAWVFASAYPARVERLVILNAPHPSIFLREVRNNPDQIKASQYERGIPRCVGTLHALAQLLSRRPDQGARVDRGRAVDGCPGPRGAFLRRRRKTTGNDVAARARADAGDMGNAR